MSKAKVVLDITKKIEYTIAASAVIIAFCSFMLTIYIGYLERKDKRLSVRPHATFSFYYHSEKGSGLKAIYSGLGPTIVKWFQVKLDGIPMKSWNELSNKLGFPAGTHVEFSIPYPNTVIKPGSSKIWWTKDSAAAVIVKENTKRISVEMCYCSYYEECWLRNATTEEPRKTNCSNFPHVQLRYE